jgi:HTTM domain
LALFRIAMGSVLLLDILLRARDLQMFYGDQGVLGRELLLRQSWLLSDYQLFLSTGSNWGLAFLMLVGAVASVCLIVGYHTRLAGLACWLFLVSIQLRNPLVLDGGDELLRLLLFWTPFLPLSARWSWEAKKNPEWAKLPNEYRSVATVGLQTQYILLYFFAAFLKNGDDWLVTGDALYYTLSIDQFVTPLGHWLAGFPGQLRILCWLALATEFLLAGLLLLPRRVPVARSLFLLVAVAFHLTIAAMLNFGIFMLIVIAGLTAFVPGAWWDRILQPPPDWSPEDVEPVEKTQPTDKPGGYTLTPLERGFALFVVSYILVVNILSVKYGSKLPGWTFQIARVTYQHQHWHLFAPQPFREDGWFILELTDDSGQTWFTLGDENSASKPTLVSAQFPNQRWRRWLQNLVHAPMSDTQTWRDSTAHYFVRRWQQEHPDQVLKSFRLLYFLEMSTPPGETPRSVETILSHGPVNS